MFGKRHTLLFPAEINRGRMYLADEGDGGGGGGGGEPGGDGAHNDGAGDGDGGNSFQLPEKFKGKSAEDIARSYQELEKELGKRPNIDVDALKETLTAEIRQALQKQNDGQGANEDEVAQKTKEYLAKLGYHPVNIDQIKSDVRRELQMDSIVESLEKEYTGKDGRPVFKREEIASYAKEKGLTSIHPEQVYNLKYQKELTEWSIKKALEGNKAPKVPSGQKSGTKPDGGVDLSKLTPEQALAKQREAALARASASME